MPSLLSIDNLDGDTGVSITAHLTEQFILKRELPALNFRWLVLGAYMPDGLGMDRLFMFMIDPGFHRDYGFGWMHTPLVALLVALPVRFLAGRRAFWSFLLSMELHVFTDAMDTLGVMLMWPFDNRRIALGWMPWYDTGVITDLALYYSDPAALLFELFFLVAAVRVLRLAGNGSIRRALAAFWRLDGWRDHGYPGEDIRWKSRHPRLLRARRPFPARQR